MTMLDTIKKAAKEAVEASSPVNVIFGEVRSAHPLEINVDQRFNLSADFLIVSESVAELKVTISGGDYIVREGLQVGDKIVLIRMQGGQKYLIVDRVVSA